jgi:hypothetical protein
MDSSNEVASGNSRGQSLNHFTADVAGLALAMDPAIERDHDARPLAHIRIDLVPQIGRENDQLAALVTPIAAAHIPWRL